MTECADVLSLSAAYLDEELAPPERAGVEAHLAACAECRRLVEEERQGRTALVAARASLRERAPASLHAAVVSLSRSAAASGVASRAPAPLFAAPRGGRWLVAATIALACAGVLAYGLRTDARLLAAQLAFDHVKCGHLVSGAPAAADAEAQTSAWARDYGWAVALPAIDRASGFEFVALRRCLHAHGLIAHAIYRRGPELVSLYVFPRDTHTAGELEIMGERAAFWSRGQQTYAAVGAAGRPAVEAFVAIARPPAD